MSQLTRLETMNFLLYGNLSEAVIGLCCRYLGSFQFTGFVHLSIFLTYDISEENVTSISPVTWGNHSEMSFSLFPQVISSVKSLKMVFP